MNRHPTDPLNRRSFLRRAGQLATVGAPSVELTVYPEAQHDSWTETYANPELYAWLLKHSR